MDQQVAGFGGCTGGDRAGGRRRVAMLVVAAVLLCIEHGLDMAIADSGFAHFPDARWINPVTS
jgi:hypothetical protein